MDFTAGQVKQMHIRGSADRVQTLDEMLQQVAGKVPLVIEIKSHWDGSEVLALRALEVLESYAGPYCLMSFDPDIIAAVRRVSPGTPRGIVELLRRYDVPIAGAEVCVVGRGVTVGRPLGLLLTRKSENATVTLCHTGTRDLAPHVRGADIGVAAAGVAHLVLALIHI